MPAFAFAIFLAAFLGFFLEPMAAKRIIPWFGGTASVWTTCILFFQFVLLAGYAYSHLLVKRLSEKVQLWLHFGLMAASLLFIYRGIGPHPEWKPRGEEPPAYYILWLLLANVGLPYFLLSTTAPLLQGWFARVFPRTAVYRLYALSNVGSLLGLLLYPLVFEPLLTWNLHSYLWSGSYIVFIAACGWCAWRATIAPSEQEAESLAMNSPDSGFASGLADAPHLTPAAIETLANYPPPVPDYLRQQTGLDPQPTSAPPAKPASDHVSPGRIALWLALSAVGSILLMAASNLMCQEIPTVFILVILPLALYLVTFIIAFEFEGLYKRSLGGILLVGLGAWGITVMANGPSAKVWMQIVAVVSAMFAGCMVCHGELARSKPTTKHLTLFYLMVALGGAIGGTLVVIVCPLVLNGIWEYPLGLAAAVSLLVGVAMYDITDSWEFGRAEVAVAVSAVVMALGIAGVFVQASKANENLVKLSPNRTLILPTLDNSSTDADHAKPLVQRNFFGVLRVKESFNSAGRYVYLLNGNIKHGIQYVEGDLRHQPTSYYATDSGVGVAVLQHPKRLEHKPMKIGVIGLGTGTMAAYGEAGDTVRFYDINPLVVDISGNEGSVFTYIKDSKAHVDIAVGDARTCMEHELADNQRQNFDVLVIDAFSSDMIPRHLLTKECMELYLNHMAEGGIIAFHISNRNLDLGPIVLGLVMQMKDSDGKHWLDAAWIKNGDADDGSTDRSDWVLVAKNEDLVAAERSPYMMKQWPIYKESIPDDDTESKPSPYYEWTDDFGSLLPILRWW